MIVTYYCFQSSFPDHNSPITDLSPILVLIALSFAILCTVPVDPFTCKIGTLAGAALDAFKKGDN